jgi:hypothetical protein
MTITDELTMTVGPNPMADVLTDETWTPPPEADALASMTWDRVKLSDLARNPPRSNGYLLRGLWPADAYGIIAAESKAGKTWLSLDLALSVATGGPFLGHFPVERSGPVLVYLGEGGLRNTYRRFAAIAAHKGIDLLDARNVELVSRPPSLNDSVHCAQIVADVAATNPALVILDPLYLSISANMGQLNEVGQQLAKIQRIAEDAGAALVVIHHWNQTGSGTGRGRMSGAGAEQWGRVLWSVAVKHKGTDIEHPLSSVVTLNVEASGGEIADLEFSLTRKVWADDADDLDSPLNYVVTASDVAAGGFTADGSSRRVTASDRALAILEGVDGKWMTAAEVQRVTSDQHEADPSMNALRSRTVADALQKLFDSGSIDRRGARGGPGGGGYEYRVVTS